MLRLFLMLLSVVAGAPAIVLGETVGGTLLLAAWFFGGVLALAGSNLWLGEGQAGATLTGVVLFSVSVGISVIWTWLLTSPGRRERRRRQAQRALGTAQKAYLRGHLREAQLALKFGLRHDERDVELLFLDYHVSRDLGEKDRVKVVRRRLERLDLDEKWLWEIQKEEALHGR